MNHIVVVLIVVVGLYFLFNRDDGPLPGQSSFHSLVEPYRIVDGPGPRKLVARINGAENQYIIEDRVEQTFMLFGADPDQEKNGALANAWLSVISLDAARKLKKKYPDFHRCHSPGASEAQAVEASLYLLTDNGDLDGRLDDIADDFQDRMRSKGDRLCVTVTGSTLRLHRTVQNGAEVKNVFTGGTPRFVLLDGVTKQDCKDLL